MKVHLEHADTADVQAFAQECPEELPVAKAMGHPSIEAMYDDFLARSIIVATPLSSDRSAFSLVTDEEPRRVLAMLGVLSGGRLWLHMAPAFKLAGLGALRLARALVLTLANLHGELFVDIETSKHELVRMADWLGFVHLGFVEKFDRTFHRAVLRAGKGKRK